MGKSCLVSAAVMDIETLKTCFSNKVYWVHMGETLKDEQVLKHLKSLHLKFTGAVETNLPDNVDDLRNVLKQVVLSSTAYSQALIVLDNVRTKDIVSSFEIGCKLVVTTLDKTFVAEDQNTMFYHVRFVYNYYI